VQAIILSAGEGTRMRPLTYTKPKVMLPIANKPILEHLIIELRKAGIKDIILVVGYRDEVIRNYFKDGSDWDVNITYVSQKVQLGTADALKSAMHLIDDEFITLNGDNIVSYEDIKKIAETDGFAIGVKDVENPQDFGVVNIEDGLVKEIVEKPEKPMSNLINAGVYKFKSEIIEYLEKTPLSKRGEYEITDTIRLAINDGLKFKAVKIEEWIDIGYPWDLLKANEILVKKVKPEIKGEVEEGAVIKGNVFIDEGTVVRSGTYIIGPVVIGKNCKIGPNCFIRPYTSIGDNCHIGAFVEVKNSIIMSNTNIPHLNYVGDSIIGENCNLGAGTKIANLRLDGREVYAVVKGKKISTGRRKFGAVISDNVKIGINVSINVGTMIGNDVYIAPSAVVEGYIEPYSKVF
jgi:bifunctional UDP-N-acetylglucosamine pyrophosphorylase/glucosamine-1-phosphate N-acetyltransferase